MATKGCPECTEAECKKQALERLQKAQDATNNTKDGPNLKATLAQKDLVWKAKYDQALNDIENKFCVTEECFNRLFQEVTKKYKLEFGEVCEDNQKVIIECYKEHKATPLLCQRAVQEYTECVNETSRSTVEKAAKEDDKKK